MTISDLIDYLSQFDSDTTVFLSVDDIPQSVREDPNAKFIVLEYIYDDGGFLS